MHEVSLMMSAMEMAEEELRKHGATRLKSIRIRYGALANIVPDAMHMAFAAMTAEGPHRGAVLMLEQQTMHVACRSCGHTFSPPDRRAMFGLCPGCAELTSYAIEAGDGIYLDHIDAE